MSAWLATVLGSGVGARLRPACATRRWVHRRNWSALLAADEADLDKALVTITVEDGEWVADVQAPFAACGRHRGEQAWKFATRDDAVRNVDGWFETGDRIAADEVARNARAE